MLNLKDYVIVLFISGLAMGAACCCDCDEPDVGLLTLDIEFFGAYPARNTTACPIPTELGDFCTQTGDHKQDIIDGSECGDGSGWSRDKYVMWVEYVTCCGDLFSESEYSDCRDECTCYWVDAGDGKKRYVHALNINQADCTPTIPFPINDSESINLKLFYREPCQDGCESPDPCGSSTYRVWWETGTTIKADDFDMSNDPPTATKKLMLMYDQTNCENNPNGDTCT